MDHSAAIEFLGKWTAGRYTETEHRAFLAWLATAPTEQVLSLVETYTQRAAELTPTGIEHPELVARIEAALYVQSRERQGIYRRLVRLSAAAAAILLVVAGAWWFYRLRTPSPAETPVAQKRDLPPGGNRATLTLAGGQTILLDSAANGWLARQGATDIRKLSNGQLRYNTPSPGVEPDAGKRPVAYNTLTTPRGGKYQLMLPDGTKVWLDAASSITYPTAFTGQERSVTIAGEAYLEVADRSQQPFIVRVGGTEIRVLGTSFNVNAYTDEPVIATTLVAGKVQVKGKTAMLVLRPGQQARVNGEAVELAPHTDLAQVLAWKNGLFAFSDADLPTVLRQLARWYDFDVRYEGTPKKRLFNGEISQNLTLRQVLQGLARSRVNFEITGPHTIVIRP